MKEVFFAYLRGEFERIIDLYNGMDDSDFAEGGLVISGTVLSAAVSTGDYPLFTEIEARLKDILSDAGTGEDIRAYIEYQLSVAYVGAGAYSKVPAFMKSGDFSLLPESARAQAAYIHTNYLNLTGNYDVALATAQAYMLMINPSRTGNNPSRTGNGSDDDYSFPDIYLPIHCSEALFALGREKEAEQKLRSVMDKYLPIGAVTPFAEFMLRLGGLCEKLLKNGFPDYYDKVLSLSAAVTENWVDFHNRFEGDKKTKTLSAREYYIARLYSRGMSYKQIALQYGISEGRVRNIMQEVYQTLFIDGSNRREKLRDLVW